MFLLPVASLGLFGPAVENQIWAPQPPEKQTQGCMFIFNFTAMSVKQFGRRLTGRTSKVYDYGDSLRRAITPNGCLGRIFNCNALFGSYLEVQLPLGPHLLCIDFHNGFNRQLIISPRRQFLFHITFEQRVGN